MRAVRFIGAMIAAWVAAGVGGALLHSRPGLLLARLIQWEAAHLPLREMGLWAIGGTLTALIIMPHSTRRRAMAFALVWALAGPFMWRPGPAYATDPDFTFVPIGMAAAALISAGVITAPRWRALPAALGGWLVGHGLFTLLTGYTLPLYILRAPIVNMQMGALYGLLMGLCGGLGLWVALRRVHPPTEAVGIHPNPLTPHLVNTAARGWVAAGVVALVVFVAAWAAAAHLDASLSLNRSALPLLLRNVPLLPLLLLAFPPMLVAALAAALTNASGTRQWMELLPLAGMPRRQIAWSYTLATLSRMRGILALTLGLTPLVVWAAGLLWAAATYINASVVALGGLALGMLGMCALGAACGVWLSLTRGPSPLWIGVAPFLLMACTALPLTLMLTIQPITVTYGFTEGLGVLLFALWPLVVGGGFIAALDAPH